MLKMIGADLIAGLLAWKTGGRDESASGGDGTDFAQLLADPVVAASEPAAAVLAVALPGGGAQQQKLREALDEVIGGLEAWAGEPTETALAEERTGSEGAAEVLAERLAVVLQKFDQTQGTGTCQVLAQNAAAAASLAPVQGAVSSAAVASAARMLLGLTAPASPGASNPGADDAIPGALAALAGPALLIRNALAKGQGGPASQGIPEGRPSVVVRDMLPVNALGQQPAAGGAQSGLAASLAAQMRGRVFSEGTTRIELAPRGLGVVEVELARTGGRQFQVTVRADNPAVLRALQSDQTLMETALRQSGVRLGAGGVVCLPGAGGAAAAGPGMAPAAINTGDAAEAPRAAAAPAASKVADARPVPVPGTNAAAAMTQHYSPAPGGAAALQQPETGAAGGTLAPGGSSPPPQPVDARPSGGLAETAKPEGVSPLTPAETPAEPQMLPDNRPALAGAGGMPLRPAEWAQPGPHSAPSAQPSAALAANITGQIKSHRIAGGTTRIDLSPRGIGGLEIVLSRDDSGGLKVTIRAENASVLGALRDNREMLLSVLRDSGAAVQSGSLGFEDFGKGARQQPQPQPGGAPHRTAEAEPEMEETPAEPTPARADLPLWQVDMIT